MTALVLVIMLNPFSGDLQTVDEVVAFSIANHLDTSMEMAFIEDCRFASTQGPLLPSIVTKN
jgi:hypothetical protein